MLDIQNTRDTREVPLMKVGVSDLSYPVKVLDKLKGTQMTTARVNLYVNLPQHFKGTHMSRFIELFHRHHENLGMKQFLSMLEEIRTSLEAERSFGAISFPFFIEKEAPVSREKGIMSYQCGWEGEAFEGGSRFFVTVSVPVTTVCPCSKAISDRGAHNQRGIVSVKIESTSLFWSSRLRQASTACSSGPTRSSSPRARMTSPASSRTWCARSTLPCATSSSATRASPGSPWNAGTSRASTITTPTPTRSSADDLFL